MKKEKRKRGIYPLLCSVVMVLMLCMMPSMESHAYTSDNVPGVQFAPDGGAWTVVEDLPEDTDPSREASYWLENGTPVETGVALNIPSVGVGQHLYGKRRPDEVIPVYKWEVVHRQGVCIHGGNSDTFHGLIWDYNVCGQPYWSGWVPFCADCGEKVCPYMHYMSASKAQSIESVNTAKDYYFNCNHCGHLEQGVGYVHECKAVSYNEYRVKYDNNHHQARGEMDMSRHMYNNATMLDGEPVVPNTKLYKNIFTREGYVFSHWNTEPDGSGTSYADEATIYNLTTEHYDEMTSEHTGEGIVTLYAQWVQSKSTLEIHAEGGIYEDTGGVRTGDVTTFANVPYGAVLVISEDKLTPPMGYKVSFVSSHGRYCAPIQLRKTFEAWRNVGTLNGRFQNPRYQFIGPNGSVDKLQAVYEQPSITLPDPAAGANGINDKEWSGILRNKKILYKGE